MSTAGTVRTYDCTLSAVPVRFTEERITKAGFELLKMSNSEIRDTSRKYIKCPPLKKQAQVNLAIKQNLLKGAQSFCKAAKIQVEEDHLMIDINSIGIQELIPVQTSELISATSGAVYRESDASGFALAHAVPGLNLQNAYALTLDVVSSDAQNRLEVLRSQKNSDPLVAEFTQFCRLSKGGKVSATTIMRALCYYSSLAPSSAVIMQQFVDTDIPGATGQEFLTGNSRQRLNWIYSIYLSRTSVGQARFRNVRTLLVQSLSMYLQARLESYQANIAGQAQAPPGGGANQGQGGPGGNGADGYESYGHGPVDGDDSDADWDSNDDQDSDQGSDHGGGVSRGKRPHDGDIDDGSPGGTGGKKARASM
jgi:hypothetical protein